MNTQRNTHNRHIRLLRGAVLAAAMLFSYAGAQAQTPPHVTVGGSVFGGGNLAPVGRGTKVLINQANAEVNGDVYGGGAKAEVDTLRKASPMPTSVAADSVTVTILQGSVGGDVYGGGLGNADTAANVYGPVFVNIGTGTVGGDGFATSTSGSATISGSVYGCNNLNGTPKDNVFVNIYQTAHTTANTYPDSEPSLADLATPAASTAYALTAVYGGGNQAAYSPVDDTKVAQVHVYTCLNTIETVYGGGNAADATKVALTIDGGRFDRVFGGGNGAGEDNPGANISVSATTEIHGGLYRQVFGGSNQKGDIASASLSIDKTSGCTELIYEAFGGANEAPITGSITTSLLCGDINIGTFYGGSNKASISGSVTLNVIGGNYTNVFGGSKGVMQVGEVGDPGYVAPVAADITGNVTLNLFGGTMVNAFGGSDANGNIAGSITVNVNDTCTRCPLEVHNVYGGGRDAAYTPAPSGDYPIVNLIKGTVSKVSSAEGNVFGGGLGSTAKVTSSPVVNLQGGIVQGTIFGGGSEAPVTGNPTVNAYYGSAPTIHGGGWGSTADVTGNPTVVVNKTADKALTVTSVYGGGDAAEVEGNTTVTLTEGAITNAFGGGNVADITGTTSITLQGANVTNIYGGGNAADVSSTATISMTSGNVSGGLYGGCNASGSVGGAITVTLTGGTVGASAVGSPGDPGYVAMQRAYVHGGGYGQSTSTGSDVSVTVNGTNVYGEVYGGSALGSVNASSSDATTVTLTSGTVYGAVYGGGLGRLDDPATGGVDEAIAAPVNGAVTVLVNGGVADSVFGCNNLNGAPQDTVIVNVTSGNANYVFGGGNVANYTRTPDVNISGGTVYKVFGGGNEANVGGGDVSLTDGTVANGLYGGCNTSGTVTGNIAVSLTGGTVGVDGTTTDVVYGGGFGHSTATSGDINVTLNGSTVYGNLYGGSALGSVNASDKSTTVTIGSNTLHGTVFGGGMGSGSGTSTQATTLGDVVINYNTANSGLAGIYGGANVNGRVVGNISVNVNANVGTSGDGNGRDIFGGGLGAHTSTDGNVTVTLGDNTNTAQPVVFGDIYGGSALGSVNNAEADLTTVNILSGTLHGNAFGGGLGKADAADSGQVNGTIIVNVGETDGALSPSYTGFATIDGSVYGCNNTNGSPQGNVTVNIYKTGHTEGVNTTADAGFAITNVFGGGKKADFNASGKKAYVNVFTCDNTIGDLYGGGDAADVPGSAVTIWGGRFDKVFGGGNGAGVGNPGANIGTGGITIAIHGGNIGTLVNASNEKGSIGGSIVVTVDNEGGCNEEVDEFFGGSNMVDITGDVNTTIECGAGTFGAVYGGSNKANIIGNVSLTIQGGTIGRVFGGSKGDLSSLGGVHSDVSANITGNVTLTLNGGSIGAAFGGSNINGTIDGTITVNVNDLGVEGCELEIDSVFGAGNLTAYNPTTPGSYPAVNIINGTVNDVVFGGGKQAAVTSSPVVTIGDGIVGHNAAVTGNVYGGGDEAGITGSTHVILNSGTVGNGIYGGCNTSGTVTVNSVVDLLGGQVGALGDTATICGGGYGQLTKVDGDVHVTFGNAAGTATPMAYARMYGGSALGSVNTRPSNVGTTGYLNQVNNVNTTTIDILSGTFNGDIFGGGLGQKNGINGATSDIAALVHGKIHVNIGATDGKENPTYTGNAVLRNASIYGCNNLNGSPQNDVYIDIYQTAHNTTDLYNVTQGATFAIANVYGGGNRADYAPTATLRKDTTGINNDSIAQNHFRKPHIYVHGCENTIEELFAGGNAAAVMGDSLVFDGGRFGDVFGGGNGALIAANVGKGGVYLVGKGGRVGYIYEHCNKRGSIAGKVTFVNGSGVSTDCAEGVLKVENHFCGGNEVDVAGDFVHEFTCRQNLEYTALYGGCRLGTTYGNITLIITGGTFGTIYGGPKGDRDVAAWVRKYPTLAELQRDSTGYDEGTGKYASLKDEETLIYSKEVHKYMKEHPEKRGNGGGNVTIILKGGTIGDVYGGCDYNGNVEGRITIIVDSTNNTLNPSLDSCALEVNNIYGGGNRAVYTPDTANSSNPGYISSYAYPYISLENGHVNQNVYGGGKGNDGSVNYGSVTSNPKIVMNPDVANSKNFLIKGNLYGGGELGQVNGSTSIDIDAGTVKGTVYGGGKGHTSHESFGLVTKNTLVDISGGTVERSVYGGGSLGSVGTFTETWPSNGTTNGVFHKAGEPKTCATNTGLCKVLLSGTAQVGVSSKAHMPSTLLPGDDEYGYVFAASQGIADSVLYPKANLLGVACTTYLEISGSALVTASAYGGSENGEVLSSTYVKVMGGQIGVGGQLVEGVFTPDPVYTSEQWTAAINAVKNGTIGTSYVNPFHECDHWPYGNAGNFYSYDIFADEEGYDSHGGSTTASDGHTFFGNVFGGGSGYYPFATGKWRRSAGRVLGHTKVEVTGGHILTSIYGGNETTDVLGDSCVVIFSGGTLGVPRTVSQMQDHPVTCYLFGAGKGDERVMFNRWTNVQNTRVTVSGGHIFGSVFGGGEDGHVMRNTKVDILGDAYIGTTGTSYVDGNVFGGGRGFSGNALTAGNTGGDADVNIYGSARLLGSVYGGGRLASVGCGLYTTDNANYGVMRDDNVDDDGNAVANFPRGHITVDIYGSAIIGNDDAADYGLSHSRGGNVFGGSMGRLVKLDGTMVLPLWHRLGCAKATTVNISGNVHVKGNVYGGSELGRVTDSITVNISGNVIVGRNAAGSYGHGNVYGGGMGHTLTDVEVGQISNADTKDSIPTFAGLTGGTIKVNISGGAINNNVYGAGELASVGTIATVTKHEDPNTSYFLSWPYEYTYNGNSGDARVNITGGTIGFINGSDTTGGNIYGSARGIVGDRYVTGRLATARVTHVDINLTNPGDKIIGDVYGSGENGHVYDSAVATLRNGLVLGNVFGGGKGVDTSCIGKE